jgi:actin-like ATPase involved in cell morphogenesis
MIVIWDLGLTRDVGSKRMMNDKLDSKTISWIEFKMSIKISTHTQQDLMETLTQSKFVCNDGEIS